MDSTGGGERSQARGRVALVAILLLSLALHLVPFWWGLPARGEVSWAFDEIAPSARGETSVSRHRGRYPPFHYQVLRVVYSPIRAIVATDLVDWSAPRVSTVLRATGRLLSVLMALGLVLAVYRLTRLAFGSSTAANLAALLTAFSPTIVYYAKTINLEVPYLFWAALSMLFFWLVLERHRRRDYLLFGLTAALAVCTKDQAAALYPLPALVLWADLARQRSGRVSFRSLVSSLGDRHLLGGLAVAVVCFVLVHDLVFDLGGFRHHLWVIFGKASEPFQRWESSPAGHLTMAGQAVRHLVFLLGLPAVVLSVFGLVVAARRFPRSLLLLTFPLSYYLLFIVPVMYHYDRFLLPIAIVLVVFAGLGLASLPKRGGWRVATAGIVGLVLVHALLRAVTIDALMWNDARYAAEDWIRDATRQGESKAVLGGARQDAVRMRPFIEWARLRDPGPVRLRSANADYVVWNMDEAREGGDDEIAEMLMDGRLNYRTASVHSWSPPIDLLRTAGVFTNLSRVSPEIVVARRVGEWGISGSEAMTSMRELWLGESDDWQGLADAVWSSWFVKGRRATGVGAVTIGLGSDAWTRPARPAFLVLHNESTDAVVPVLRIGTAERTVSSVLVVAVRYELGEHRLELATGEHADLALPEIGPGQSLGVLVVSDAAENPEEQPRRRRSVRLRRIR